VCQATELRIESYRKSSSLSSLLKTLKIQSLSSYLKELYMPKHFKDHFSKATGNRLNRHQKLSTNQTPTKVHRHSFQLLQQLRQNFHAFPSQIMLLKVNLPNSQPKNPFLMKVIMQIDSS
jgi:hypothetical protein